MNKESFRILGIMSGTSLDGVDFALVSFLGDGNDWSFTLEKSVTVAHDSVILKELKNIAFANTEEINALDLQFGAFLGREINKHFQLDLEHIDFISSHGHTAKHNPNAGYTIQIGSAEAIHEITKKPVINNFRAKDVSLGGQGAPLVPVGDRDLFSTYDYCLNLGGIANISFSQNRVRLAFDISPLNMALNEISNLLGKPYDDRGLLAAQGYVDERMLNQLEQIAFYKQSLPKSLGYEDYVKYWAPALKNSATTNQNKLRTLVDHFAHQIAIVCKNIGEGGKMVVTGGGAHNDFFINQLKAMLPKMTVHVPHNDIINYKEAIIFAYLGLLRYLDFPNCLSSVTGARVDSSGGDKVGF